MLCSRHVAMLPAQTGPVVAPPCAPVGRAAAQGTLIVVCGDRGTREQGKCLYTCSLLSTPSRPNRVSRRAVIDAASWIHDKDREEDVKTESARARVGEEDVKREREMPRRTQTQRHTSSDFRPIAASLADRSSDARARRFSRASASIRAFSAS